MLEVDHATVVRLRPEARRRDVPPKRLVTDLLDALGDEPGLVGAILDPAICPARRRSRAAPAVAAGAFWRLAAWKTALLACC